MNRRDRGFALILVIWALVLLASLATGFAFAVRHEVRVAGDMASIARAEAAATAALHSTALTLSRADPDDRWQVGDVRTYVIPRPGATVRVRVRSESGRIDINRAPRELLIGLFVQLFPVASAESLADALIDWRDHDDEPGPEGAEKDSYSRAGYAYAPSNAAFSSIGELERVLGFDARMLETVRPYLTVHSHRPRINVLSADLVALRSVPGIDAAGAEELIAQRDSVLALDGKMDLTTIPNGKQYLEARPNESVLSIDIDVRLDDGHRRYEHAVIKLYRTRLYLLLARETRAVGAEPHRAHQ